MMALEKILQKEGFGTRRACRRLIESGAVKVQGIVCQNPSALFSQKNLPLTVENCDFLAKEKVILALNKPVGVECSQQSFHQSIFSFIPQRFVNRAIQPIGRLDVATSGLIFLTDDGQLNHFLTAPKNKIPRVYIAECAEPLAENACTRLKKGILLKNEKIKTIAESAELLDEKTLKITLSSGKYHEVRRLVGALNNRVVALKRVSFGKFFLPNDLALGEFLEIEKDAIL